MNFQLNVPFFFADKSFESLLPINWIQSWIAQKYFYFTPNLSPSPTRIWSKLNNKFFKNYKIRIATLSCKPVIMHDLIVVMDWDFIYIDWLTGKLLTKHYLCCTTTCTYLQDKNNVYIDLCAISLNWRLLDTKLYIHVYITFNLLFKKLKYYNLKLKFILCFCNNMSTHAKIFYLQYLQPNF